MKSVAKALYKALPFKPFVFRRLRAVYRPPASLYQHLHFYGPFQTKITEQSQFMMRHHGNQVENALFWTGFGGDFESTSLAAWVMFSKTADTIYDIGANTGVYALSAKASNPAAHVVAFEPIENIHAKLDANIALNSYNIVAERKGVSDMDGEQEIYDTVSDHSYSASIGNRMDYGDRDVRVDMIQTVTLDSYVASAGTIGNALVKIDTERHEVEVLRGAASFIREHRPTFLIEILDRALGHQVEALLPPDLYDYYEVVEGDGITRVPETGAGERNYIFLPKGDPRGQHLEAM